MTITLGDGPLQCEPCRVSSLPALLVSFSVVVLTHVAETFRILPVMGWGLPNSAGHYLDLASAVLGCTLRAAGSYVRC